MDSESPLLNFAVVPFERFMVRLVFRPTVSGMKTIRRFLANESGATAIEYGLIAAGILLAIIAIVNGLGAKLNTKFTAINSSLK
jgi:pilus assembly protein Flp/PilA